MEELRTGDTTKSLPLHFKRPFRPWSYEISHRRLVLRSDGNGGSGAAVEVEFLDVLGMKIRSNYEELLIDDGTAVVAEIDRFVDVPELHSSRYLKLLMSDGRHEGFVVCGSVRVHRDR